MTATATVAMAAATTTTMMMITTTATTMTKIATLVTTMTTAATVMIEDDDNGDGGDGDGDGNGGDGGGDGNEMTINKSQNMKRFTIPQSIAPLIGTGTYADHSADSAARHSGRMRNRFQSFHCSWVRGS